MSNLFITGNSNGLGLGLTRYYLQQGYTIYSLSRSPCPLEHPKLNHVTLDLSALEQIDDCLSNLIPPTLNLVILNAGILGTIQDLAKTRLNELKKVMDINVWSNKMIIDWIIHHEIKVEQLTLMSSGASVNGNRGWGAYSLSKATLNMLAKLYAHEMPHTHISALAPGLIHTRMQDYLCHEVDQQRYPSIQKLIEAYGTEAMPNIDQAAALVAGKLPACQLYPSGSFIDIRQIPEDLP
ncbi:MAG: SDR family NAD(P)-dependent oxidoreductase [Gammaproteobacteria bacterium]|nr:SDR family NAD(P)-dependent oxidoreductase [Gammaproteobacteria bacterium]